MVQELIVLKSCLNYIYIFFGFIFSSCRSYPNCCKPLWFRSRWWLRARCSPLRRHIKSVEINWYMWPFDYEYSFLVGEFLLNSSFAGFHSGPILRDLGAITIKDGMCMLHIISRWLMLLFMVCEFAIFVKPLTFFLFIYLIQVKVILMWLTMGYSFISLSFRLCYLSVYIFVDPTPMNSSLYCYIHCAARWYHYWKGFCSPRR